jgi:DNA primase
MREHAIVTLLESILGKGKPTSENNVVFQCPFCNHHKPKLEINIVSQHWHCWVCNSAGRKLLVLLRKLHVTREKTTKLIELLDDGTYQPKKIVNKSKAIELPAEFKPLWKLNNISPEFRNAVMYLKRRGVTIEDILKYRIGYCETGQYNKKIIIPSYDENGNLNYFVSRAYYHDDRITHKNPTVSKDIIGFELHINWQLPIVLVEGAFDAIAVKRNAIPLFGKTISNALKHAIIKHEVRDVYICLDRDARKQAIATAEYFIDNGINVYFVDIDKKDPSELGFKQITHLINTTCRMDANRLMGEKILCAL